MRDAVVVAATRSPLGRRGGSLADVHPVDLSAQVLMGLLDGTGLDPAVIDDVVWGCVTQGGEQSYNTGRSAVLTAGWPHTVPAVTIDRQCGSSQQAVHFAAAGLIAGEYDVVVAGGVESMSRVPMFSQAGDTNPYGEAVVRANGAMPNQGVSADLVTARWGLSRAQLDEFSLASHAKAAAAQDAGAFLAETTAIVRPDGDLADSDEGIRRGGTPESLSKLAPVFTPDGAVTAGNASQISDGAAALLLTTSEHAARLGLTPLARIHAMSVVGDDPHLMLTGPIPATAKVLSRAGLALDDIDVFEVNEAFAPVPLAWLAETGADPDRLNPRGGAIALGHPLGASGARLMTTLISQLRDSGGRFGLQTMCEGGGLANATIIEAL